LLGKAKFKQFDVVLIPLLHIKNDSERKKFINNYLSIINFIKFILMHQEIMSINKASPSQYGNDFKIIAKEIFEKKDYKAAFKKFLNGNLQVHSKEHISKTIRDIKIDHNNTKHAKQIIMLLKDNVNIDMTVEHFIPLDEKNETTMKIGNCIPVNADKYDNLDIKNKLIKYEEISASNPFIKEFLQSGIDETNCVNKIEERTEQICKEYAEVYEKLYNELNK